MRNRLQFLIDGIAGAPDGLPSGGNVFFHRLLPARKSEIRMSAIAYFHCDDAPGWSTEAGLELTAALLATDQPIHIYGDLARLAASRDACLVDVADLEGLRIVSPFHPRAVRWLMHAAGADLPAATPCLATQGRNAADVLAELLGEAPQPTDAHREEAGRRLAALAANDDWRPWVPVIDYDRCAACGQCVAFCLFGVYAGEPRRVLVERPANCKNNCPACARVCPESAIIFPKHNAAPINADDAAPPGPDALPGFGDLRDPDVIDRLRQRAAVARAAAERKRAEREDG
jgi:NAD-dependent dihydropyrimidine dehydrogenase PreA subunit